MSGRRVLTWVFEEGKLHPVEVILEDGERVSLDPWDVAAMSGGDREEKPEEVRS